MSRLTTNQSTFSSYLSELVSLVREETLSKCFCLPCQQGSSLKSTNVVPREQILSFQCNPHFQKRHSVQKIKVEGTTVISLSKMVGILPSVYITLKTPSAKSKMNLLPSLLCFVWIVINATLKEAFSGMVTLAKEATLLNVFAPHSPPPTHHTYILVYWGVYFECECTFMKHSDKRLRSRKANWKSQKLVCLVKLQPKPSRVSPLTT